MWESKIFYFQVGAVETFSLTVWDPRVPISPAVYTGQIWTYLLWYYLHYSQVYLLSYTLTVKLSDFTVWHHTRRKNWVNCAVLTDNSACLRTVFSSSLSHTELRSSLRESHFFLSLPADTTMTSSQGTSVSSNSFSRWASHDIFLFKYHFLLHILPFLFFFSDNVMVDVASKQQTASLFSSTIVTRTRRHTKLTKKLENLMGNLCYASEHSGQFFVQFFTQLNCTI